MPLIAVSSNGLVVRPVAVRRRLGLGGVQWPGASAGRLRPRHLVAAAGRQDGRAVKSVDTDVLARFFVDDPAHPQASRQRASAPVVMSEGAVALR